MGNNFFRRHETLVKVWLQIFKRAGFTAFVGASLKTYAQQLGIKGDRFQQKADIGVLNWEGRIAWFDVGVTAIRRNSRGEDEVKTYASHKNNKYHQGIKALNAAYPESVMFTDQWVFIPLVTNSLGVWDDQANDILQKCAAKLEKRKQGLFIQLWFKNCL